jgi:putative transcriptional regulator
MALLSALLILIFSPHQPRIGSAFPGQCGESPVSPASIPPASPGRSYAYAELSKGRFLVAGRSITDPRFSETVVLLLDYGVQGAVGLIINRPSEVRLSRVFPEIKGMERRSDTLYFGGPVGPNQMFMLIRSTGQPEESYHVVKDIYVSGSRAVLQEMTGGAGTEKKFQVYAGYSGWAAQQLEREVARGDWYVMQADAESIFDKEPSEIWPELFRRGSAKWVRAGVSGAG